MEEMAQAAGLNDVLVEQLGEQPVPPIVSNKKIALVSSGVAGIGIIISILSSNGYLPHYCVAIGGVLIGFALFGLLIACILAKATAESYQIDPLSARYRTALSSDTPEGPSMAEQPRSADIALVRIRPDTEYTTRPEAASSSAASKEESGGPVQKIEVEVYSQIPQKVDSDSGDQPVQGQVEACCSKTTVEVTGTDERSVTKSGTEEAPAQQELLQKSEQILAP